MAEIAGKATRYKVNSVRAFALIVTAIAAAVGTAAPSMAGQTRAGANGQLALTLPMGSGAFAHLWIASPNRGGHCFFVTVDERAVPRAKTASAGPDCTRVNHLAPSAKERLAYTIDGPQPACPANRTNCGAQARTIIYGELDALSPIARLAVVAPDGSHPASSNGHWFIARLPTLMSYRHWRLIAYAAGGKILGRIYF